MNVTFIKQENNFWQNYGILDLKFKKISKR